MNALPHIPKQILRLILGILALALPIILPLTMFLLGAGQVFEGSISAYYYTEVKWLYMIILILFGLTCCWYALSSRRNQPIIALTGVSCLLIVFFPTTGPGGPTSPWINTIHMVSAVAYFALLGWMIRSVINLPLPFPLLTKIGTGIWIVLAALVIYFLTLKNFWPPLVYVLETVILWLFTIGIYIRNKITNRLSGA